MSKACPNPIRPLPNQLLMILWGSICMSHVRHLRWPGADPLFPDLRLLFYLTYFCNTIEEKLLAIALTTKWYFIKTFQNHSDGGVIFYKTFQNHSEGSAIFYKTFQNRSEGSAIPYYSYFPKTTPKGVWNFIIIMPEGARISIMSRVECPMGPG